LLIPTGYAQASVHYDFEGHATDDGRVVFGILAAAYDQSLAQLIFASWRDSFDVVTSNDCVFLRAEIRTSDDLVFVSTGIAASGTVGGGMAPPNTAYLLRKVTALGGRKHRGRSYVPGVPRSYIDGAGGLTTATTAAVQGGADDFLAFLGAADVSMQLLHTGTETPDEVTAWQADHLVATQRRRLRK